MTPTFTLPSTFILTLLLLVGLFFFTKAATKDRTQHLKLSVPKSEEVVLKELDTYLQGRAYRLIQFDREQVRLTFEGMVQPSVGLALFLMTLMAVGLLCLGLVLSMVWPQSNFAFLGLMLLSPLSGWLYWRQAKRPEQVVVKVEAQENQTTGSLTMTNADSPDRLDTLVTVMAHRDELTALKSAFKYKVIPEG